MFRKQIDYVLPYYHRNSSNAISTYQPSLQHSPTPPQFYTLEKKTIILLRIILIFIIIIILVIAFMQGICKYIPETNHVSRVYSVAAVLYLQFVLQVMLFRPWNIFFYLFIYIPSIHTGLDNHKDMELVMSNAILK